MSAQIPLTERQAPSGTILLGRRRVSPVRAIGIRVAIGLAVLAAVVAIVYLDRDGYRDSTDGSVSLLDALYYSTVTLSTTGYGDITPVNSPAQALAFTEALVGQLYLTILVARLVGLYIANAGPDSAGDA